MSQPGEAVSEYSEAVDLFKDVQVKLQKILSEFDHLIVCHGPYLVATNVCQAVWKHFQGLCKLWEKFEWRAITGNLDYIEECISDALDDMPLCPSDLEEFIKRVLVDKPKLSRGQVLSKALFRQIGSAHRSAKVNPMITHCQQSEACVFMGVKEADSIFCPAGDWDQPLIALEVAYRNESLSTLSTATAAWAQQGLLAIGLMIDGESEAHILDPRATLFIAHPSPSAGLSLRQFTIGYGCGFPVDQNQAQYLSHGLNVRNANLGPLLSEIDWDGQQSTDASPWFKPVGDFALCPTSVQHLRLPLSKPVHIAFLSYLLEGVVDQSEALARLSGKISLELMRFIDRLEFTLDLAVIRSIILPVVFLQLKSTQVDDVGSSGNTMSRRKVAEAAGSPDDPDRAVVRKREDHTESAMVQPPFVAGAGTTRSAAVFDDDDEREMQIRPGLPSLKTFDV